MSAPAPPLAPAAYYMISFNISSLKYANTQYYRTIDAINYITHMCKRKRVGELDIVGKNLNGTSFAKGYEVKKWKELIQFIENNLSSSEFQNNSMGNKFDNVTKTIIRAGDQAWNSV